MLTTTGQRRRTDTLSMDRLYNVFDSPWNSMIEVLGNSDTLKQFHNRGVVIHTVYRQVRAQINAHEMTLDVLLENEEKIVILAARTDLQTNDVTDFLETLDRFPTFFPRYHDYKIYGGVAGLMFAEDADKYAYRKGLFVLSATGDGVAQIKNDMAFRPKNFAHD